MNTDNLLEEMNEVLDKLRKLEPDSDAYSAYVKRLADLQQLAIKDKELDLKKFETKERIALERRELALKEEDIRQKERASRRQTVAEYAKTTLSIAGTGGAILLTQFIEHNDIIRTKGWNWVTKLLKI